MTGHPGALERAVPLLRCPQCTEPVEAHTNTPSPGVAGPRGARDPGAGTTGIRCAAGHSFDRARHGYLTLFGPRGRRFPGDTTDQILARERVQGCGVFDTVAAVLTGIAREQFVGSVRPVGTPADSRRAGPGGSRVDSPTAGPAGSRTVGSGPVVLDVGAGTGFYLRRVLDGVRAVGGPGRAVGAQSPLGIGTELSVAAARRLAKTDPDAVALVTDTWDALPLADESVDLVQVVFAPRNVSEFARILRPGGILVVAGPGPGHLEPLRSDVGMLTAEPDKADRLESGLAGSFTPGRAHVVDESVRVSGAVATDLALMGPSGVHLDRGDLERSLGSADREIRVHVEVRTFRPAR